VLEVREVAQMLGVGVTKVYEMIRTKELPSIRLGRLVRIPRIALYKWIEERSRL
jgi:excisionase family DNA binding protein